MAELKDEIALIISSVTGLNPTCLIVAVASQKIVGAIRKTINDGENYGITTDASLSIHDVPCDESPNVVHRAMFVSEIMKCLE